VHAAGDAGQLEKIRGEVEEFTVQYPLPHITVEMERSHAPGAAQEFVTV
jgi:hypothetical protein